MAEKGKRNSWHEIATTAKKIFWSSNQKKTGETENPKE